MEGLSDIPMFSPVTLSEEFLWRIVVVDPEELDEILQQLHSALVYASQWHNTFTPAACLPGDVLLVIFEHALPDRDTCMLRILSQAPLLWHKALNLADRSTWFAEVLRRTQAVPLEVFFDIAEDYTGYAIPNLTTIMTKNLQSTGIASELERSPVAELLHQQGNGQGRTPLQTVAGAVFLTALELPSLVRLEVTVNVGQLSTNIFQFMGGVQLATSKMPHLPSLYIYYGHHLLIFHSNHFCCFTRLQVTFKNWALDNPTASDTHFTDLIRGIADVVVLWRMQELKVSPPISIEWCLALDAWTYFLCHLKTILHISFGAHAPVFLIRTLLLDACRIYEGMQAQSRLLPSLEHIALPSIPGLQVLVDVLADARSWVGILFGISTSLQARPHMLPCTGQPIEVVCQMVLDWLADPVVHSTLGNFTLFVDDEGTDSDELDELDELLDEPDKGVLRSWSRWQAVVGPSRQVYHGKTWECYYDPILAYREERAVLGVLGFRKKCMNAGKPIDGSIPSRATGSSINGTIDGELPDIVTCICKYTSIPLAVGFAADTHLQFDVVVEAGADGVTLGSHIFSLIKEVLVDQVPQIVEEDSKDHRLPTLVSEFKVTQHRYAVIARISSTVLWLFLLSQNAVANMDVFSTVERSRQNVVQALQGVATSGVSADGKKAVPLLLPHSQVWTAADMLEEHQEWSHNGNSGVLELSPILFNEKEVRENHLEASEGLSQETATLEAATHDINHIAKLINNQILLFTAGSLWSMMSINLPFPPKLMQGHFP
ncbi:hypothetical protein EDD17DRAFT_1514311 [Pisolithus thermaeus]|nr:hypothetical protein EV401DRAFT_1886535 [Pisolithus croceorrhizus]KAI6148167.1 hypothetical protein EDD17DRAFT_1514311 [Pisolithus thermaeus]